MDWRDPELDSALRSFRDNLHRDKVQFQCALNGFLSSRKPTQALDKNYQGQEEHLNELRTNRSETGAGSPGVIMLDTRRIPPNRRNAGRGPQAEAEVPKYGLPGMGQYEEKQKQYKEELKNDYKKYMREQNANQSRRQLGNDQNGRTLDYEEVLARKREEERNYRNRNDGFVNGGMRSNSDGYLNRMPVSDYNYGSGPNVDVRPEVEEVTGMLNRIQRYNNELSTREEEDVNYNYNYDGTSERPHSYPHDVYEPPISYQNGQRAIRESRRRSESPKFITLDHVNPQPRNNERNGGATDYQADLARQVEDSRFRRQKAKEEELRYERKLEEENKAYDPWGRGGGGAPMRDREGNVVANRRQLASEQEQKQHPGPRPQYSDFTDANNRKKADVQDAVPNYAISRSPLPGQSNNRSQGKKVNPDSYKEDLRKQIEDKKQREKEAKERERLDEEALMRRIQEENDKIKRDHEEETKKQQQREEERRRRNEELQRRQEEQRKAAATQRKDEKNQRSREQLDVRERTLGAQGARGVEEEEAGRKSPPLPTRKTKLAATATNRPTIASHHQPALPKRTQSDARGPSKDHILSQLSTMRQQLEKEQEMMQKQLKKEMGGGYEVFDRKKQEMPNQNNRTQTDNANKPSIYRQMTPPPQLNHPVKKGVEGYEISSPGAGVRGGKSNADWERDRNRHGEASDEYRYDADQLAAHNAARHRYRSTLTDEPDEMNEDSFLDEFLAKNLQR